MSSLEPASLALMDGFIPSHSFCAGTSALSPPLKRAHCASRLPVSVSLCLFPFLDFILEGLFGSFQGTAYSLGV